MKHDPTIHILWQFTDKPWGGGNQFLKALRQQLIARGCYTDDPSKADIILFNSHQFQKQLLQLKRRLPNTLFVHRVDGPLFHTRGESGIPTDRQIFFCNKLVADGTIFQSEWSRKESYRQGMQKNAHETCIINAPDPAIFHPGKENNPHKPIRLIATTWSSNPRKGFDIFHYLDEHLDFKRYQMTFVGNTEISFRNIKAIAPQPSDKLADLLRSHDIFVAASRGEPCSNSFLEALHCGLAAVARNDASYPELLGRNGLLFEGTEDIIATIEALAGDLDRYRRTITAPPIDAVAERYVAFFRQLSDQVIRNAFRPKRLSAMKYYLARIRLKTM